MKNTRLLLGLLIVATAFASPAFAQAYRSQLRFLEQFAVRQYERGDRENALKQFGWILRLEPDNAVAREYLQKASAVPASANAARPQRANEIISDINSVKEGLRGYEQEAHDLERLIRDLITENDALYQALYKRSREVTDMRQKFYGTPYGDAYAQTMKGVPIDRVPQRLHPSNDILPDNMSDLTRSEQEEINRILKDIAALDEKRSADGSLPPQLHDALQAKRDMLIQKTLALAEKRNSLLQLKEQLTNINAGLRRTNSRYLDAIGKVDAYYNRIKDQLAKKNYIEQKMFSELVTDYAAKVREIEELKGAVRLEDNSLTRFKPVLALNNDTLLAIDNTLKAKDEEILAFKTALEQYKADLERKDTMIVEQHKAIMEREKAISAHQALITEKESAISLKESIISEKESAITRQESIISEKDALITAKKTEIEKQNAMLLRKESALSQRDNAIARQQANLALASRKLGDVNALIDGIEASLQPQASRAQALPPSASRKIESQSQHIRDLEAQNRNMASLLAGNEITLNEALRHIRSLEAQLVTVTAQLKKPLGPMNDTAKQTLREAVLRLNNELKLKQKDLDATNASINALTIREQLLVSRLHDHNDLMTRFKKLESDHALHIKASARDIEDLKTEAGRTIDTLKAENASLRQTINDTAAQLTSRDKELAKANQAIQTLQEEVRPKDERIAELSKRAAAFEQEARTLHPPSDIKRAVDMSAEQELKKRLTATTEKLAEAEALATRLSLSFEDLKEKIAERDARIEQLKAAPMVQESAAKKALIAAVVTKDEELAAVKARLKTMEQTNDETNARVIAQAVAAKEQELLSVKQTAREQSAKIQSLMDANTGLAEKMASLTKDNADMAAKVSLLTAANNDVTSRVQALTDSNASLAARIQTLTDQKDALADEKDDLLKKIDQLAQKPAEMPAEMLRLTMDLKEKDAAITRLAQELDTANRTIKTTLAMAKETQGKKDIQQIKQEALDKMLSDREARITLLTDEVDMLKKDLAAAQAAQREHQQKTAEAAAAKKIAEGQLTSRDQDISQLKSRIRDLGEDLKAAQALAAKKDRDHDVTLKELRRQSDLLEQQQEKIRQLKKKLSLNARKEAPAKGNAQKECKDNCVQPK